MDTGDDDYPGSGYSKKLAGGFLTPNARTLTDSWKLREQVALVSCPRSEPYRFGNPLPISSHLCPFRLWGEGGGGLGKSRPGPVILFASHPTTELPGVESSFKSRMLFSSLLSYERTVPGPRLDRPSPDHPFLVTDLPHGR